MLTVWLLNWFILSVSVFVVTRVLPSVHIIRVFDSSRGCFRVRDTKAAAYENPCIPFSAPDGLDIRSVLFCD